MALSRRELLALAAASPLAMAQGIAGGLAVTSDSGLRLEVHGDPQRPAVALYLPATKYAAAIIEMPEHAWRKDQENGPQSWFYKMYTSEKALQGQVTWAKDRNTLSFVMKTPSGFRLSSRANLEPDGVAITQEVIGSSESPLAAVQAVTCTKLYPPFTDVFLERTYVHHPGGLDLIASETPDRLRMNAEEWLPCRYIAQVGKNPPHLGYRVERLEGVSRYFKSRAADAAFIATESLAGDWTIATHSFHCDSVFTNPARSCQHADPTAYSVTGGRAVLNLKVYALKGTVKDIWNLIAARERSGEV